MKLKLFILSLAAMLAFGSLYAQDEDLDKFDFETEPLQQEKAPYFAIAVGYTANFMFPNVDELNSTFAAEFELENFPSMMYMSGVQGFTGVVVVPNLRAGFFGASGSSLVEFDGNPTATDGTPLNRSGEFSLSYNGFAIDYAITPIKSLAILPGLNLGWGSMTLEAFQTRKYADGGMDWGEFNPGRDGYDFMKHAEAGFMFVEPTLNVEFALTSFSMIRVSGSYAVTFTGSVFTTDWEFNRITPLENVPDGINGNGFKLQAGLFIGLFNY